MAKKLKKKFFLLFLLIFYFLFNFYGCMIFNSQENQNYIIGINSIKTLNPFLVTNGDEQIITNLLYGSLFSVFENSNSFEPFIAKNFEIHENKVVVQLHKDFLDSNGNKIDSKFLTNYFKYFQKKIGNDDSFLIPDIRNFHIDYDKNNLILTFSENISIVEIMQNIGHLFTFPVISPEVFIKFENDPSVFFQYGNIDGTSNQIISTGYWQISEIEDDEIKLGKNNNKITQKENSTKKTITFKVIKDNNQILQKLINKEIDICFGDAMDADFLKKFYTIKTIKIDNPENFYVLLFNYQSANENNRKLINDINFRKKIYNILSYKFIKEKYITAAGKVKKIQKYNVKFNDLDNLGPFQLFSISDDSFSGYLSKEIEESFTKNGLKVTYLNENLNSMIARIYATKNWDFFITTISINFPFLMEFDLFNPFSFQHLFNINIDNNIELILPFEKEIYQKIERKYQLILKNPNKLYKEIEDEILKYCIFIPLGQSKLFLFTNKRIKNVGAKIIRRSFYLKNIFE